MDIYISKEEDLGTSIYMKEEPNEDSLFSINMYEDQDTLMQMISI